MSIFDHWQQQKEPLRQALARQTELSGAVYQLKHALLQTEQNALAEMTDDVLRQQAGVLMSFLKTSMGLLETPALAQTWVAQPAAPKHSPVRDAWPLWLICVLLNVLCGVLFYFEGSTLGWLAVLATLVVGVLAFLRKAPKAAPVRDELHVTLKPDAERLLSLMDGQMRAVDRALNDLTYLNDQLRGGAECNDSATLSRVSDLLEALYDSDEAVRLPAIQAAQRMLEGMGLIAVEYSEEQRALFNALPSKTETRTLSPAILSKQDRRLLRRGTAAVRQRAA